MALSINTALTDSASTACFEIVTDTSGDAIDNQTIITPANLSGADAGLDNEAIVINRVVATVTSDTLGENTSSRVTLSWGEADDLTEFLHLPVGTTDLSISFKGPGSGNPGGNVMLDCPEDVFVTLRIFVKKMTGFPLSMGHAAHRP